MAPSWKILFDSYHSGMDAAPAFVAIAGKRMPATADIAILPWMSSNRVLINREGETKRGDVVRASGEKIDRVEI